MSTESFFGVGERRRLQVEETGFEVSLNSLLLCNEEALPIRRQPSRVRIFVQ